MKIQEYVVFVKKSYKNYHKVRDHYRYTGEHRVTAHSICNLKCNELKKSIKFFRMDQTIIIVLP